VAIERRFGRPAVVISTYREGDMTALATRIFPRASVEAIADFETFLSVSLFCFGGLLVSVSIIVADKYIPGEWF
jgi:hypothetical protein